MIIDPKPDDIVIEPSTPAQVETPPYVDDALERDYQDGNRDEEYIPRPRDVPYEPVISDNPPEWDPSADQTRAVESIVSWADSPRGLLTLGGFGGSGKTHTLGYVAYNLLKRGGLRLAFATPTGKAAQVLRKSLLKSGVLKVPVSTVHGLIYRPVQDPTTGRVTSWAKQLHLPYDLIVLDEASMVSKQMYADLSSYNVPILAIGDHGQLPPVGEDSSLMANPDIRLERVHRQAKGNPIIRLSTLIRNGAPDEALKAFIRDANDPRLLIGTREEAVVHGAPPGVVLTYTNKLRSEMNARIREHAYGLDSEEAVDPVEGEVVICLKNHRLGDSASMIANGMRGVVRSCQPNGPHTYRMSIEFDEPVGLVTDLRVCKHQFGREKTFAGFDQVPGDHKSWFSAGALLDYGGSCTVHKFQGSQADNVAVILEWVLSKMEPTERRRWLYTAVSRASERLMLVF